MNGVELGLLNETILNCVKCPRLVHHREETARVKRRMYRNEEYWGRPLTGYGDIDAKLLLVGLAPAAHGGNRTGRMFTGDRSGDWLYGTLHKFGFRQPTHVAAQGRRPSAHRRLRNGGCPVRSAGQQTQPGGDAHVQAVPGDGTADAVPRKGGRAPGKIAHDSYLECEARGHGRRSEPEPKPRPKFGHGEIHTFPDGTVLLSSYHPSQQNTQTGRLTTEMFEGIFATARRMIDGEI